MDSPDELIARFVETGENLEELREWRRGHLAVYEPPQRDPQSSSADIDRWFAAYSDWQICVAELHNILSLWQARAGGGDPDAELRIYRAVAEIGLVFGESENAGPCYLAGRWLYKRGLAVDALPYLEISERGFSDRPEHDLHLQCLRTLVEALLELDEVERAEREAARLTDLARQHRIRVFECVGLDLLAQAKIRRGDRSAIEFSADAVSLRRVLSEAECDDQACPDLPRFLFRFARIARDLSRYDDAMAAYSELEESAPSDRDRAFILSEIGQTLWRSGEHGRAVRHLEQASTLARNAGDPENALRWSLQARSIERQAARRADDGKRFELPAIANLHEIDGGYARLLASAVEYLLADRDYTQATPYADVVLAWAQHHRDVELQIEMHNALGLIHLRQGRFREAVQQFHRGIYWADKSSDTRQRRLDAPGEPRGGFFEYESA